MKRRMIFLLSVVGLLALGLGAGMAAKTPAQKQGAAVNIPKAKEFRIERSMSKQAQACLECHKQVSPGIFVDWSLSRHASANITCLDCHQAEPSDKDVSQEHFKQYQLANNPWGKPEYRVPVAAVVTPKDCSRCHPDEVTQYDKSKHAHTIEIIWKIDPWLNAGLNSTIQRATGCYHCHGSVVKIKGGKLDPMTWPNVGVGRVNLDGSLGSCTSCHTRHRFSIMDARKPEACGACHLGPDHPQIEIFKESKHGDIYDAFGSTYNWTAAPGTWTPGVDYRGPTCAVCHMSGVGKVLTTHDVTERLSWELQAPLTIRPSQFKPFPAKTNWEVERNKMKDICQQCHSKEWADDHFVKLDAVVKDYNDVYFKPAKKKLDELYAKKLMDPKAYFRQPFYFEFYELWHHEGRRARMGAAMMAPDYTWWHGFYELKKRYVHFMEKADDLIKNNKKAYLAPVFPGATGSTEKPPEIFGKKK